LDNPTTDKGNEMDTGNENDHVIRELIGADLRDSLDEELELEDH
jgi:hypothetical protein